jgi:hypothetical protein
MGEDSRDSRKSGPSHRAEESIIALGMHEIESLDTGHWLDNEFKNNSSSELENILNDGPDVNAIFAGLATPVIEFLWKIGWSPESSLFWYE